MLSVVIPTYNRASLLERTLSALFAARAPEAPLEVIVVDDGSSDDTAARVAALGAERPSQLRYVRQENLGPAAARNTGVRIAHGDIVLFLGDDIIAGPGLLVEHVRTHHRRPGGHVAVLGYTPLHPDVVTSPLATWWEKRRFRYHRLLADQVPDFTYFYTHNVSVGRDFLIAAGGFDESFPYAAYEDTELAFRLRQMDLEVIFAREAVAYHHHKVDLDTVCRQMQTTGASYDAFVRKTGAQGLPRLWKLIGDSFLMQPWLVSPLKRLAGRLQYVPSPGLLYAIVLMYHFQVGRGLRPDIAPGLVRNDVG